MIEIAGRIEPRFEPVRDAFRANFELHGEIGAACCVYVDGVAVVDICGGLAEADGMRPYDNDALTTVFSSTKGMTAVCANLLVQRGTLDPDAPVAEYWPEFAQVGKGAMPVRYLLAHTAGLVTFDEPLSRSQILEWTPVTDALAAQRPYWEPGTAHSYHSVTFGFLVGEVIRRITGETVGEFFRREVAQPLSLAAWIGLPTDVASRVSPIIDGAMPREEHLDEPDVTQVLAQDMSVRARSLNGALPLDSGYNEPAVQAAELPGTGGITNASSLAKMYAALTDEIDGVRLFNETTLEAARGVEVAGADKLLVDAGLVGLFASTPGADRLPFGAFGLGFMLPCLCARMGGPGSFGAPGKGGSLGFADPENRVAFGYVMNKMLPTMPGMDPRSAGLVNAVYSCL